jgi:hypothetical protein
VPQWTADGEALCTAELDQAFTSIASDGAGGAIVAWQDERTGIETDIYAQHVGDPSTGIESVPPAAPITVVRNVPNPFAGTTEIQLRLRVASSIDVEVYDVAGRRVRAQSFARGEGLQWLPFDGRDEAGRLLPSGVYFYRVSANGQTVTSKMVIAR